MKKVMIGLSAILLAMSAFAVDLTTTTVKVVIPFPPGGGVDATFKNLAAYAERKNIKMIPMYKPGADGLIGLSELSKMPKDGFNVGIVTTGNIATHRVKTGVDDIKPLIGLRNSVSGLVVNPASKIKNLSDFEHSLRTEPVFNFGVGAPAQKMVMAQVSSLMKVEKQPTIVPYKGGAQVLTDLLGNHITAAVLPMNILAPHIESGKLNLVAVVGSGSSPIPGVPSIKSKYSKWTDIDWYNFVLPPDTDAEIKNTWTVLLKEYLRDQEVLEQFKQEYTETVSLDPKHAEELVKAFVKRMDN